jgi:hypothetical protein
MAGMAHHKVHGNRWTVGPILPHRDRELRVLHRPSTAATLNLAAAAAQGARLFAGFDRPYADTLLAAAVRAYRPRKPIRRCMRPTPTAASVAATTRMTMFPTNSTGPPWNCT